MKKLIYLLILSFFVFTSCEETTEIIDLETTSNKPVKKTYVPDNTFEQLLIDDGFDDVLDNYVLTSSIDTITEFGFPYDSSQYANVVDHTGLEDFTALTSLYFGGWINTIVDFSKLKNLETLNLIDLINTTTLDLSKNKKIKELKFRYGDQHYVLTSLDLSKNMSLTKLVIEPGGLMSLTNLKLPKTKTLTELELSGIGITSLDLSKNKSLYKLHLDDCLFTTLDLSNNHVLTNIYIYSHDVLTSLNLQNGNNKNFDNFYVNVQESNPSLFLCFQVDDAAWSTANWSSDYTYSEDCY